MATTPTRMEVNLKRLLQKCEEMMERNEQDRLFDKYLDELQKKLAEVQGQKEATKELSSYANRVNSLLDSRKPKKPTHKELYNELLEMKNTPNYARKRAPKVTTVTDATPVVSTEVAQQSPINENMKREELISTEAKKVIKNATIEDESQFEQIINKNRNIQDEYTEEMASLAKTLKENSYNISNIIAKDNKNLDVLDSKVSTNLTGVGAENEKLKMHIGNTCSWTLCYWMMMFLATFVFVFVYIFIKMNPKK